MHNDPYYIKYKKYKLKYNLIKNNQHGGGNKCGRHSYDKTPPPICKNGGISANRIGAERNLINYLECANPKYFSKQTKQFTISNSRTVVVSDVHQAKVQKGKDVKNVKPGKYNVFIYKSPAHKNDSFYIALHNNYNKKDIKGLNWVCHDTFSTDVANGGLYDKKYYDNPNEIKNIIIGAPGEGWDCTDKPNKWNECKRYTISLQSITILPHGFYASTCGDGGYNIWIAKNKNLVIGFGFTEC